MADTKISALTSGNPAQSGDEIPIARSGANYKITAGSIAALGGDVDGPASAVDNQIALFDSTTGKLIKAATTTGLLKASSGVIAQAVSGTDYAPATSGTAILYGNNAGGFSNVTVGSGLSFSAGTLSASGGGSSIPISDEGTQITAAVGSINFTGSGVTATAAGSAVTVNVSGGGGAGTVTSVDVSGGTTGLTTSGGPVTSSGTITLAGTLTESNGGTGETTYTNGQLLIGNASGGLTKATLTAGSNVTITNGDGAITIAASSGGGGGGLTWQSVQTGNFTASAGNAYPVNTTSAAITVTLPASPSAGDSITLTDYAGTFATNNMTVSPNGNKINSSIAAASFAINQSSVQLVYVDSTQGWKAYSYSVNGLIQNIPIDYVLIAGGGAGGFDRGGGGGAGGYLSGSSVNLTTATAYTVTIGAGAAARTSQGAPVQGSNSVLASFTSTGGGGGQGADQAANSLQNGGSGGGGAGSLKLTGGTAVSGQGNAGGTATYAAPYYGGGGGGGASSVGGNGTSTVGGNGGTGTASSITGTSVSRAGGGGAGTYGGSTAGTASSGGGNGATNGSGTSGTANTGGGGGGGGIGAQGGSGGSGVVIIAYPDTYPALASIGAGLTYDQPTRSGYRVYRFTAGTGTISW